MKFRKQLLNRYAGIGHQAEDMMNDIFAPLIHNRLEEAKADLCKSLHIKDPESFRLPDPDSDEFQARLKDMSFLELVTLATGRAPRILHVSDSKYGFSPERFFRIEVLMKTLAINPVSLRNFRSGVLPRLRTSAEEKTSIIYSS